MFTQPISAGLGVYVLIAAAGGLPNIDIAKTCRASQDSIVAIFGENTMLTYENCLNQEQDARRKMSTNWAKYQASDKMHCVQPSAYMPSYVEWLTCFEIQEDVRKFQRENASNNNKRSSN